MLDNKLITFLTLARVKNYTKTAEILNLTQPAVSQHIKFLEETYGIKFIKKTRQKYISYRRGRRIFSLCKGSKSSRKNLMSKIKK